MTIYYKYIPLGLCIKASLTGLAVSCCSLTNQPNIWWHKAICLTGPHIDWVVLVLAERDRSSQGLTHVPAVSCGLAEGRLCPSWLDCPVPPRFEEAILSLFHRACLLISLNVTGRYSSGKLLTCLYWSFINGSVEKQSESDSASFYRAFLISQWTICMQSQLS